MRKIEISSMDKQLPFGVRLFSGFALCASIFMIITEFLETILVDRRFYIEREKFHTTKHCLLQLCDHYSLLTILSFLALFISIWLLEKFTCSKLTKFLFIFIPWLGILLGLFQMLFTLAPKF